MNFLGIASGLFDKLTNRFRNKISHRKTLGKPFPEMPLSALLVQFARTGFGVGRRGTT